MEDSSAGVRLQGVMSAMCTPFSSGGAALDEPVLRDLVDVGIDAGLGGLVPGGSTGEFTSLTRPERERLLEVVVDQAAGRVPVVAHAGATTTAEAVELARHGEAAGAAAILAVHPYYTPLSLGEVRGFYEDVAGAVALPIIVYNIPPFTGMNLPPDFLGILAREVDGVAYVKDTSGDIAQVQALMGDHDDALSVLNGWDAIGLPVLALGATAMILGSAGVMPRQWVELFGHVEAGRMEEARALWGRIWPVTRFLLAERVPGSVKAGSALAGLPVGEPRAPHRPLAPDKVDELRGLMATAGALGVAAPA